MRPTEACSVAMVGVGASAVSVGCDSAIVASGHRSEATPAGGRGHVRLRGGVIVLDLILAARPGARARRHDLQFARQPRRPRPDGVRLGSISLGSVRVARVRVGRVDLETFNLDALNRERFTLWHAGFARLRLELKCRVTGFGCCIVLAGHDDFRRPDVARRLRGHRRAIDPGIGGIGLGRSGARGAGFSTLLGLLFAHVKILHKRFSLW
jgi:hypothetical protein